MKHKITSILLALSFSTMAQTASITINTDRVIGGIDPNIYGVFMEPIGRSTELPVRNTLYGPVYDPSSPLANEDGFKTNYIEAMRELKITNMRWPGGNYVASYNWQDGIGPKEQRPVRKDLAWGGYDPNQVGTDEWVKLNKAIGSESVICINLGLGDISNSRYWIEYTNIKSGTYFSDLRAKYGNPEPYNVKYWCLGNEVDGSPWIMGYKNAEDYCKIGLEAAKALKAVDSSVKLVANGSSYYEETGIWLEWNRKVITALTGVADYLSVHRYWHDGITKENRSDYYSFMGEGAMDFEEKIKTPQAQVNIIKALYPEKTPLQLSVDEWGAFGNNISSVLGNAMCLNSFIRHADFVKMANFTMMTSLLANDSVKGTYKSPLFYAFKLFTTNCRGVSLDTYVQCETFNVTRFKNIPYLDVTSVTSEDGKTVYINVINRHKEIAINTEIKNNGAALFNGKARIYSIEGSLDEVFCYDKQNEYAPKEKSIEVKNGKITYAFPPHSLTQIAIQIK
ncbi:MAG: alpha-L-arabinofuranosidase C-terminal domain-containing protein [Massilibacteroides sp.]|nr:alpha-L-arabinofuranosidase C-terminal domain-containing protein [Massilibacteroides sp.]